MERGFLIVLTVGLCACAGKPTVSEFQCKAGDWETIGYRDGAAGIKSTQLLAHQEACGEFGIIPHRGSYLAGWNSGLKDYCTAENGFNLGQRGAGYNGVCPENLKEPFATAYEDGRQLYQARSEVNRLTRQLGSYENRLLQIKQEIVSVSTAQLEPDLTTEERLHLLADLDSLVEERSEIKAAIPVVEQDLQFAEQSLDRISQDLAGVTY